MVKKILSNKKILIFTTAIMYYLYKFSFSASADWWNPFSWGQSSATGDTDQQKIDFLNSWGSIFQTQLGVLVVLFGFIISVFSKLLYQIAVIMSKVYESVFALLGFVNVDGSGDSTIKGIAQMREWLFGLGAAIGVIVLIFYALVAMTGSQKWAGWKPALQNMVISISVVTVLPFFVSQIGSAVGGMSKAVLNQGGTNASLPAQIVKKNTTNMIGLAANDFKNEEDGEYSKNSGKYYLTADDRYFLNGGDNGDVSLIFDGLGSYISKDDLKDKAYKDVLGDNKEAFEYRVVSIYNAKTREKKNSLMTTGAKKDGLIPAFASYYPKYTAEWIPLLGQLIILTLFYFLLSIRVGKSIFEIAIVTTVSPLMVWFDMKDAQSLKDAIKAIMGGLLSILSETVVLFLTVAWFNNVDNIVNSQAVTSITNGDPFITGIFSVIAYAAGFFGAFQGIEYIQKVTGVDQNGATTFRNTAGAAAGGYAGARRAASSGKSAVSSAVGKTKKAAVGGAGLLAGVKSGASSAMNRSKAANKGGVKTAASAVGNGIKGGVRGAKAAKKDLANNGVGNTLNAARDAASVSGSSANDSGSSNSLTTAVDQQQTATPSSIQKPANTSASDNKFSQTAASYDPADTPKPKVQSSSSANSVATNRSTSSNLANKPKMAAKPTSTKSVSSRPASKPSSPQRQRFNGTQKPANSSQKKLRKNRFK